MPNWCNNIITISQGDESKEAKKQFDDLCELLKVNKENNTIGDNIFNKLVPMPESLNITSGGSVNKAMAVILYEKYNIDTGIKVIQKYPWAKDYKTIEDLIAYIKEDENLNLEEGQIAIDNVKNYGHKDWFDWRVANWGSKWDSGDEVSVNEISDDQISLEMSTAWSPPTTAFATAFEKLSLISIEIEYEEPSCGFEGTFTVENGESSDDQREYDATKNCEMCEEDAEYCDGECPYGVGTKDFPEECPCKSKK